MATDDTVKDFDYYLNNPGEVPTDPAMIDALLGLSEEADAEGEQEIEAAAEDTEQADESAATGADDKGEQADPVEQEAPISSKDGKHTIPYSALTTEREQRKAAERVAQELQQRITALEERLANPAPATQPEVPEADLASDEEMAQLVQDFPAVGKILDYTKKLETQVKQFEGRFKGIEEAEAQRQEEAIQTARSKVETILPKFPELAFWRDSDPERWAAAMEADDRLLSLPGNQKLTMEERFAKAVAVVDAFFGPSEVPQEYLDAAGVRPPPKEKAPAAKDIPKPARTKPAPAPTLSDLSGGTNVAADPLEEIASLSTSQLGARMGSMRPDQITSLLSRLG